MEEAFIDPTRIRAEYADLRLDRTAAAVRRRAMDLGIKLAGSKRELGLKAKPGKT
jgi:hypothetical protein